MLNVNFRQQLGRITDPIGRALAGTGITPNTITTIGTAGVCAGALALYPTGHLLWGTVVITAFIFSDLLDGAVARASGTTGTWGAFLDSSLDRVADAAIFTGLAWWLARGGDDPVLFGVAMFCLACGTVISYIKARAEGLGMTCNVGIAERAERTIVVLVAAGVSGLGVPYVLAVGLWLLAAASAVTVVQRVVEVRRQAVARPAERAGAGAGAK